MIEELCLTSPTGEITSPCIFLYQTCCTHLQTHFVFSDYIPIYLRAWGALNPIEEWTKNKVFVFVVVVCSFGGV